MQHYTETKSQPEHIWEVRGQLLVQSVVAPVWSSVAWVEVKLKYGWKNIVIDQLVLFLKVFFTKDTSPKWDGGKEMTPGNFSSFNFATWLQAVLDVLLKVKYSSI